MKLRHHLLAAAFPAAALLAAVPAAHADTGLFSRIQAPSGVAYKPVDLSAPMRVLLSLPLHDEAGASAFGRSVSDPYSANYGRYITPQEFARRFGGDAAAYESLRSWGAQHGFTVGRSNTARTIVPLSGTTGQFAALFKTQFAAFDGSHGAGRVMVKSPTLPDGLAGKIDGIVGLESAGNKAWLAHPVKGPVPAVGTGIDGSGYAPKDLRTAYDVPAQKPATKTQVFALFEQGGYPSGDLTTFEKGYKLPNVPVKLISVDGSPTGDNGADIETDLDLDAALGQNPDLKQILIYIDSYEQDSFQTALVDSFNQVADDNIAKVLSVSYGQDEAQQGTAAIKAENKALLQEQSEGITVLAASGDQGAEGREQNGKLNAFDPCAQPLISCVGGTTLTTNANSQKYISEVVWFDSNSEATGGGVSKIWKIPSWQLVNGKSVAVANGGSATKRNEPDIAADADPNTGLSEYDSSYGGWIQVGGTSLATPLWASWLTIANSTRIAGGGAALGYFNPFLYQLGEAGTGFHDITKGSNGTPGFTAGPGYDNDTGWGSTDLAKLLPSLTK